MIQRPYPGKMLVVQAFREQGLGLFNVLDSSQFLDNVGSLILFQHAKYPFLT
jgi:hypothetical protein